MTCIDCIFTYYRVTDNLLLIFALLLLPVSILITGSCSGISGRTQVLLTVVHSIRCLHIYCLTLYSSYVVSVEIVYSILSAVTFYLIYCRYSETHDADQDNYFSEMLVFISFMLAMILNFDANMTQLWWAFSLYLESVAIIPQIFLTYKTGTYRRCITYYVAILILYRAINLILNQFDDSVYNFVLNIVNLGSGIVQILFYIAYMIMIGQNYYKSKQSKLPKPLMIYTLYEPTLMSSNTPKDIKQDTENLLAVTDGENKNENKENLLTTTDDKNSNVHYSIIH